MINLLIALAIFFGLIFMCYMWPYIPAIYHAFKEPERKFILLVEPSVFRTSETYVAGPYNPTKSIWLAREIVGRNPYTEVQIFPATTQVFRGDRVIYDGKTGRNDTTPVW